MNRQQIYPPSRKTASVSLGMKAKDFRFGGISLPTKRQGEDTPGVSPWELHRWIEARKLGLLWLGASLALIGMGVFWWRTASDLGTQIEVINPSPPNSQTNRFLLVDVAGAVNRPGVYSLEPGARVQEAISSAGGLSPDVSLDWIASTLNQAAKVADGQKIYIPFKTDQPDSPAVNSQAETGKTNINTASQAELEVLPGVGPVTAGKIISARPYSDVSELLSKKIVGNKVYDQIKDRIQLW